MLDGTQLYMGALAMIVGLVALFYLLILVVIGAVSSRRGTASAEDYFLAGRSFGTVVLFMALFGTNVTAFAMLGLPGLAYHKGVSVFGFFGAGAAVWSPLVMILLGYPIWRIGRRHGFLTPGQMFQARWSSPTIGYTVFGLLMVYTVPYMIIGIMGGAIALSNLTEHALSYSWAAILMTAVTVLYTSLGGMRGTAWTNVFQASVFMVFLGVACVAIGRHLGGPVALHDRLVNEAPYLLTHQFSAGRWASGLFVGPLSIIAFPHMFIRLLTARDARALKRTMQIYPFALVGLFCAVTFIGTWGALVVPGLKGQASDNILPLLVEAHLPAWLSAVGLAAILAAVMSSLDAQLLTLSTMVAVDVFHRASESNARRLGRQCVVAIAIIALLVALKRPNAIFNISVFAFSGYSLLVPPMIAAFFWRRSTAAGIVSSTFAAHTLLVLYTVPATAAYLPVFDAFPVALCFGIECVVLIVVSLLTAPPHREAINRFAQPFATTPAP